MNIYTRLKSRFAWQYGRQNYYYQKFKLYSFYRCDAYLVRYGRGTAIGWHADETPGFAHYRINIQLRGVNRTEFFPDPNIKPIYHSNWLSIFRADKVLHCMGISLEKGLILSFGFIKKE